MINVIPKNSKYKNNFFKFLSLLDVFIIGVVLIIVASLSLSNLSIKWYLVGGLILSTIISLTQVDGERVYHIIFSYILHFVAEKKFNKENGSMKKMQSVQKIEDSTLYYEKMYSKVAELSPIAFMLKSEEEQDKIIRKLSVCFATLVDIEHSEIHINKLSRPISYEKMMEENSVNKLGILTKYYEEGQATKEEYDTRGNILLQNQLMYEELESKNFSTEHFFFQVIADYKTQVEEIMNQIIFEIDKLGMECSILNNEELGIYVKNSWTPFYDRHELESNEEHDFLNNGYTKEEIYNFLMPSNIDVKFNKAIIDDMYVSNLSIIDYPIQVGNAWGYDLFHIPNSRVTMKIKLRPHDRAMKDIDKSIKGLKTRYIQEQDESVKLSIETHIESLTESLKQLQLGNDHLYDVSMNVTIYEHDIKMTERKRAKKLLANSNFRTSYNYGETLKWIVSNNLTRQTIGSSVGIPATTLTQFFPFMAFGINDPKGVLIGSSLDENPCHIDIMSVDGNDRVNRNLFIIGQSGAGKSYLSKLLLVQNATSNTKIIIFDAESEYVSLARNMNGVSIDVSNATGGRINPFEVMAELEEDDKNSKLPVFKAHLQFLDAFLKVVLPKLPDDIFEQLSNIIIEMYERKGINDETNFEQLKSSDYPIFDDLANLIEKKLISAKYEFELQPLRMLKNYLAKFASGGRYANLWNGYTTMNIDANFINFNFRAMLITENKTLANAQMLLILKFCNLEVIKNKELNDKRGIERKIIIFIDESHVYFNKEMQTALNFFSQMARRIRKYYGSIIFTTQNIGDFISTAEIADKTKAIMNACQYSFIFGLAPNALNDVMDLYNKSGSPLNENELDFIRNAERGQVFAVVSRNIRAGIQVVAPTYISALFDEKVAISNELKELEDEGNVA